MATFLILECIPWVISGHKKDVSILQQATYELCESFRILVLTIFFSVRKTGLGTEIWISISVFFIAVQLDACTSCHTQVTTNERSLRYCSNCGQALCSKCSDILKIPLEDLGHFLPVRVCERCFQTRKTTHPLVTEEPMNEEAEVGTEGSYLSNSASYNRSGSSKF